MTRLVPLRTTRGLTYVVCPDEQEVAHRARIERQRGALANLPRLALGLLPRTKPMQIDIATFSGTRGSFAVVLVDGVYFVESEQTGKRVSKPLDSAALAKEVAAGLAGEPIE